MGDAVQACVFHFGLERKMTPELVGPAVDFHFEVAVLRTLDHDAADVCLLIPLHVQDHPSAVVPTLIQSHDDSQHRRNLLALVQKHRNGLGGVLLVLVLTSMMTTHTKTMAMCWIGAPM